MDPKKSGNSAVARLDDPYDWRDRRYGGPGYGPPSHAGSPFHRPQYYRLEITRSEALFLPTDLQESVIKYFAKRHPGDPESVVLHATEDQVNWFTAAREAHQRRFGPSPFAHNASISSISQAMFSTHCYDSDMSVPPPIKLQLEECIPVKVQKEVKINSSNIEL